MPLVFSYGTLQKESVQLATFGRTLAGRPDELPQYEASVVWAGDSKGAPGGGRAFNANVTFNGRDDSSVMGTVLDVTDAELAKADDYEKADSYERIRVTLRSGIEAWVYRHASGTRGAAPADAESEEERIRKEFQARRRRTWRKSRYWIGLAGLGFAGMVIGEEFWPEWVNTILFLCTAAGAGITVLVVRKHFRCPACGEIAWTSDGSSFSPAECPHCEARLA